jgi:hypothetical protein
MTIYQIISPSCELGEISLLSYKINRRGTVPPLAGCPYPSCDQGIYIKVRKMNSLFSATICEEVLA